MWLILVGIPGIAIFLDHEVALGVSADQNDARPEQVLQRFRQHSVTLYAAKCLFLGLEEIPGFHPVLLEHHCHSAPCQPKAPVLAGLFPGNGQTLSWLYIPVD